MPCAGRFRQCCGPRPFGGGAERQPELAAFATATARFIGASPAEAIPFYLIADPDDTSMGGGYNGRKLTLEILRKKDAYPTVLHELLQPFVELKKDETEAAIRSVPGLDFET